jgi:hypothetical protein
LEKGIQFVDFTNTMTIGSYIEQLECNGPQFLDHQLS